MGAEMISYLQQLELLAFFSGFPLIYLVVLSLAGRKYGRTAWKQRLVSSLPIGYGLTGLLYWGLLLKSLYPNFSFDYIKSEIQNPFLTFWGLGVVVFLLPLIARKPVLGFLHSLVFFALLVKDFYVQLTSASPDKNILRNDMKVYSDSILLNAGTLIAVTLIYYCIRSLRKIKSSTSG
jgi:hypothetical protein